MDDFEIYLRDLKENTKQDMTISVILVKYLNFKRGLKVFPQDKNYERTI